MKNIFYLLTILLGFSSCYKEDIKPQEPLSPQPIVTDTTHVDTTLTFKNQTWVIYKVLNTDLIYETRSDTLVFLTTNQYTFNDYNSNYGLTLTPYSYKINLYDTMWGNLCGTLYNYNMVSGRIDGLDFFDIFDSGRKVKIWMKRI